MLKRLALSTGRLFNLTTNRLTLVTADIAAALVLFMAVAIGIDVFLRYVFGAPTIWINEASRYGLLMVTFLGLAYTLREKAHIKVDVLINRLPRKAQDWMNVINSIVFLVFTGILSYLTWGLFWGSVEKGSTSTSLWNPLIAPWQVFIPLGLAIIGLLLICNLYTQIKIACKKAKETPEERAIGEIL